MKALTVVDETISAERRRALEMLADAGTEGHPHALVLDYGVTRRLLTQMIRNGQAVAVTKMVRIRRKKTRVSYVKITDAGLRALVSGDAPDHGSPSLGASK